MNGGPEVWMDSAMAGLSVHAGGDVMQGLSLVGTADMELDAGLPLSLWAGLAGDAGVEILGDGSVIRGATIAGDAPILTMGSGAFTRWAMLSGGSPIEVDAVGDVVVVGSPRAIFDIEVRGSADLRVADGLALAGDAAARLSGLMVPRQARTSHITGKAGIDIVSAGRASLLAVLAGGVASIRIASHGAVRYGGKAYAQGTASISLQTRGSATMTSHVFAEGSASIQFTAHAERAGVPAIPDQYVEAPRMRSLFVSAENRRMTVPAERRLQ